jgi:hypothetical protein
VQRGDLSYGYCTSNVVTCHVDWSQFIQEISLALPSSKHMLSGVPLIVPSFCLSMTNY